MASLKYIQSSTLQSVTLGSAYTAGSGTMTLTAGNGAYLPSSGDFWLSYNNGAGTIRLFKVTARSSDTLTVTAVSGEGSGDGNISSGETLRWALTYDALDQLRQDICQTGTFASAASEKAGNIYLPNNGVTLLRDSGSLMVPWGPIYPLKAPVNTDFSDLGAPTTSTTYGGILVEGAGTPFNIVGRIKSAPATPYTITAAFLHQGRSTTNSTAGLLFRESSSGKLSTFNSFQNSGPTRTVVFRMTNATTYAGVTDLDNSTYYWGGELVWLRISDDGTTNRTYSRSRNGQVWTTLLTQTRTTHLTADQVGFYADGAGCHIHLVHWSES